MPKELKIEAKGITSWNNASQVVFNAVSDAMDDIREDALKVTQSLAPKKSGALERGIKARRYSKNLDLCWFKITATAYNPKDGYDYAVRMNDSDYRLGKISRSKTPTSGRFTTGMPLKVGTGYMNKYQDYSLEGTKTFIDTNIKRKLRQELKRKS